MPTNKRESFIFTTLMCAFMVFCMSIYNIGFYTDGISLETIKIAWLGFPLAFGVALILDWFLVSRIAKGIAFKFAGENKSPLVLIPLISTGMVCGMVLTMSMFGALCHGGLTNQTLNLWLSLIPKNFVVALPLQLLIAGPLVRFVFRKAFPVGVISC